MAAISFGAKLCTQKFSPRENASFISRLYDQLLQSCPFPIIRLDKLILIAVFLILNPSQIVYRL